MSRDYEEEYQEDIGIRYTVMIQGKQSYLYYEEPCWFVEGKR